MLTDYDHQEHRLPSGHVPARTAMPTMSVDPKAISLEVRRREVRKDNLQAYKKSSQTRKPYTLRNHNGKILKRKDSNLERARGEEWLCLKSGCV